MPKKQWNPRLINCDLHYINDQTSFDRYADNNRGIICDRIGNKKSSDDTDSLPSETARVNIASAAKLMILPPPTEAFQHSFRLPCAKCNRNTFSTVFYWTRDELNKTALPVILSEDVSPAPAFLVKLIKGICNKDTTFKITILRFTLLVWYNILCIGKVEIAVASSTPNLYMMRC